MERQRILERERRWARPAAAAAMLAAPLYVGSMAVDPRGPVAAGLMPDRIRFVEFYRAIEASGVDFALAVSMRGFAFVAILLALVYLFGAVRARAERVSSAMLLLVFIGPVLFLVQAALAATAQLTIASEFVAEADRGGDVFSFLADLIDESSALGLASSMIFPAVLGTLIVMIYVPLQAFRVGLLTRFFATLGMALGAGLIIVGPALGLLVTSLWFLWLGLLFVDRTPGPRPPAWEAGVAIPWPKPGDQPVEEAEEEVVPEDFFERNGNDAGPAPRGHSERSEQAKKRKRKRRR